MFDDRTIKFPLGEGSEHNVIEGIEMALKKMKKSQQIRVKIEPSYAWNDEGHQEFGIPPDATVIYEVTLLDYVKVMAMYWMWWCCVDPISSTVKRILGV